MVFQRLQHPNGRNGRNGYNGYNGYNGAGVCYLHWWMLQEYSVRGVLLLERRAVFEQEHAAGCVTRGDDGTRGGVKEI